MKPRGKRRPGRVGADGAFLLFEPRGKCVGGSIRGETWRAEHGTDGLERLVRTFAASRRNAGVGFVARAEVKLSRLSSRKNVRVLVLIAGDESLTAAERRLSPMQLQVARHAAGGATLREIAGIVGRSAETIRSHLREVYLRLDVASRLELARALAR